MVGNTDWLLDYALADDVTVGDPVAGANFSAPPSGITWPMQPSNVPSDPCMRSAEVDAPLRESDGRMETGLKKRARPESRAPTSSKACREKLRRDKLNDKFMELGSVLEPGRPARTDKSAILVDAVRILTQLRGEAQKLKDSNSGLQEKIKELKAEKNELRDEKQRLKAEKDRLEQQLKTVVNPQPGFFPPPPAIQAAYAAAQGQVVGGNKMMPYIGYPPGVAMWQFMPPAAVDTSQDHVLRPPVA